MPKAKTPKVQVRELTAVVERARPNMAVNDLETTAAELLQLSQACSLQAAQQKADAEHQFMTPFTQLAGTYWYCEWSGYQEIIHREIRHYVSCQLNSHRQREGRLFCDVQSLAICCTNVIPTSKLFGKKTRGEFYNEQFGFHQRVDNSQSVEFYSDLVRSHRCQTTKEVFDRVLAHTTEQAQAMTELMVGLINNDPVVAPPPGGRKLVIPQ